MKQAALYTIRDAEGHPIYVGVTCNVARRLAEHRSRAEWWGQIASIDEEWFATRGEALDAEAARIDELRPSGNKSSWRGSRSGKNLPLSVWMAEQKVSQFDLADALSVKQSTISRLCAGARRPSWDLAVKIEQLTHGKVPVAVWAQAECSGNAA